MASYEQFLSRVLIEVPGCSEIAALLAIKDTCIDFCEKSLVLVRDHDPVTVQQGVVDYDLEPPLSSTVIVKITHAWLDSTKLEPVFPDAITDAAVFNRSYSSYQSAASTPLRILQKDERTVSLWPVPDKDYVNGLTMRVAMKPTRSSTSVDDVIYEEYVEAIASGALSRLLMSVGKTYSNPQAGVMHGALYTQRLNVARSRAIHGHLRTNLRVRFVSA